MEGGAFFNFERNSLPINLHISVLPFPSKTGYNIFCTKDSEQWMLDLPCYFPLQHAHVRTYVFYHSPIR